MTGSAEIEVDRILGETFVRHVDSRATTVSTNTDALQLTQRAELPLPALVLAEQQTGGRGRGKNRWWSDREALTFSLIFDGAALQLQARHMPRLALTVSVAVCKMLAELLPSHIHGVRWPNDVLLEGRKVCGILVEIPPGPPHRIVIGLGINVNTAIENVPDELQRIATSMRDISGNEYERTDVLLTILKHLHAQLCLLAEDDIALSDAWKRLCVLTGRHVEFDLDTRTVTGTCRGIAEDGTLVIQTQHGIERLMNGSHVAVD